MCFSHLNCPAFLLSMLLLVGCADNMEPLGSPAVSPEAVVTEPEKTGTDLRRCEQELTALQKTAPEKHRQLQAEFNRVMHAASNYSGVRDAVSADTQQSADAFYEYKTSVVCSQVRQETLEALTTLPGA